jgi:hypothetical protein
MRTLLSQRCAAMQPSVFHGYRHCVVGSRRDGMALAAELPFAANEKTMRRRSFGWACTPSARNTPRNCLF